jgi:cytochrome b involved in lipid metabolism
MWCALHGRVFDLTEFYMEHPGGWDIIEEFGGKDATVRYEEGEHNMSSIRDLKKYYVGEYEGKKLTL